MDSQLVGKIRASTALSQNPEWKTTPKNQNTKQKKRKKEKK